MEMAIMHKTVTAALRQRLLRGEYKPGELLPTTQELAAGFATSVYTVQKAMAPLVREGLVERRRNLGTVARHNPAVLTCAGIYAGAALFDEWEYAFRRELYRQLQRQLGEQDVRTTLFPDIRPRDERVWPLREMVRAVETREIQALFVVGSDPVTTPWLKALPVTSSFVSSNETLCPVGFDHAQMLRLALGKLRDRGCKSVAIISAIRVPSDVHHPYFRFYDTFVSAINDTGLCARDDWVITPSEHVSDHERYGYEAVHRLRQASEQPDGLLVYPDTSARGAMLALLELGVRVPEELKVVCHRNTGVHWTCPLPVSWVESDTARCAAEMIRQVRRQKAGQAIETVRLPYEFADPGDPWR